MPFVTKELCKLYLRRTPYFLTLHDGVPFKKVRIGDDDLTIEIGSGPGNTHRIRFDELNELIDSGRIEHAIEEGTRVAGDLGNYKLAIVVTLMERVAQSARVKLSAR